MRGFGGVLAFLVTFVVHAHATGVLKEWELFKVCVLNWNFQQKYLTNL